MILMKLENIIKLYYIFFLFKIEFNYILNIIKSYN